MGTRIYKGSCHCKKVQYEAKIDFAQGTFKCNCSICTKGRIWGAFIKETDLKLTSGEQDLGVYGKSVRHHFCKNCGIKVFGKAEGPDGPAAAVMVMTLDGVDPRILVAGPVTVFDGRHDRFDRQPDYIEHL